MLAPKEKLFVGNWYYERFRDKAGRNSHKQFRKDIAEEIRGLRKELATGKISQEEFNMGLSQLRGQVSGSYAHHTGGSSLEEAYTSRRERLAAGGRTQEIDRYSTSHSPTSTTQPLEVPADKAVTPPSSPNGSATTPTNNTKGSGNSKLKIYRSNKKMTTMGKVGVGAAAALGIGGSILAYQHYKNKKK